MQTTTAPSSINFPRPLRRSMLIAWLWLPVFISATAVAGAAGWKLGKDNGWEQAHKNQPIAHFPQRLDAIKSQAGQMTAETIIIGDSLTEFAKLDSLCGAQVLNAGVSGATVQDASGWAPDIVSSSGQPKRLIFALGTNNAKPRLIKSQTVDQTLSVYRAMIARFSGYQIAIATVPNIEDAAAERFDRDYIANLNTGIRALAADTGVTLIELDQPMATRDGVHLQPASYDLWKASMNTVCAA